MLTGWNWYIINNNYIVYKNTLLLIIISLSVINWDYSDCTNFQYSRNYRFSEGHLLNFLQTKNT